MGDNGNILHYDGKTWKSVPITENNDLYSIWGSSAKNIFVSGDSGVILHYDGSSWNSESGSTSENLFGISGISAYDVITVGNNEDLYLNTAGVIFQYNGKSWNTMTAKTTASLLSVWGSSGNNIFAAGTSGTILHFDGSNWHAVNNPRLMDRNYRSESRSFHRRVGHI